MTDFDTRRMEMLRDARLADQKPKDKVREKESPSAFDAVLEQSRVQPLRQQNQNTAQQSAEYAGREVKRREDQEERGKKDEQKKDREGDGRSSKERIREGKSEEGRVIGKGQLKDGEGRGGSGGHSHQDFGGQSGRKNIASAFKKDDQRSGPISLVGRFENALKNKLEEQGYAPHLTQEILNKLVQYVRIGINTKGEKEIRIDLSERLFRGLQLRVISQEGKVAVHFRTRDPKARALFEKDRDTLKGLLEKKGLDVSEIVIE